MSHTRPAATALGLRRHRALIGALALVLALLAGQIAAPASSAQEPVVGISQDDRFMTLSGLAAAQSFLAVFTLADGGSISVSAVSSPSGLGEFQLPESCLLYTSPSPRDQRGSRMPSSA